VNPRHANAASSAISAISATGLRKAFGTQTVLDGVDLQVEEGSVFALLGPNGAGKTTLVHILTTLLAADGGAASIGGHDVATDAAGVRRLIGVTGQFSAVDTLLTGRENLRLMARLRHLGRTRGQHRVAELLEQFDLVEAADKPVVTYSGGMQRRLDLAMTLIGEPRILFLDEPTTGLDPRSRKTMWDIVRLLVADGVTILLTTQYLEEADQLADRVAVLDRGRIVAEGSPGELKRRVPGGHVELLFASAEDVAAAAVSLSRPIPDDGLILRVPAEQGEVGAVRSIFARLDASGVPLESLSVRKPDLDDVFFALTGDRAVRTPELAEEAS
jgi:ABC-2 type transport system ATP-binding protein